MAKNTYKSNTFKQPKKQRNGSRMSFKLFKDRRFQLSIGFFLLIGSVYMMTSFVSYLVTGKADQSVVAAVKEVGLFQSGLDAENWLGVYGAILSHTFIFSWFGIATFLIPPFLFVLGYLVVAKKQLLPLWPTAVFTVFFLFWTSILMGYLVLSSDGISVLGFIGGGVGFELAELLNSLIGWGTLLFLAFSLIVFVIYFFNITKLMGLGKRSDGTEESDEIHSSTVEFSTEGEIVETEERESGTKPFEAELDTAIKVKEASEVELESEVDSLEGDPELEENSEKVVGNEDTWKTGGNSSLGVDEEGPEFIVESEQVQEKMGKNVEHYDPTLDLSSYKYPSLDLLNEHDISQVQVTKEELEENKDKIIETLINFKIGISSIKATIGPTVTLYEIVPEAGVKISRIKNLEDDIALSLAALGIRIIAPIPGKGTIGIEVPNKKRELVGIRSVLSIEKFLKCEMELPIVLGKTISNEVYITDLTQMPHLLMAGATGQGKSVGLNVILTSLLYKKHPSQLKFILVDPKKVELTLFNKIQRHFLAKLPDVEDAIITDTRQVVNTLNSLCIEMDNRYNMMKDGGARNLKEYNKKFIQRRLNPEKGHKYLPYIVLIIDELADLMMTAGKEVETPIARLAQLARAIGIHLVVATQRPSVNVITGIIKANFPTRMSFKVTSKVDSRTILDTGGADQLVGMGDMLLSQGSDIIRLQSPFVHTDEVENVCNFIGEQRSYDAAYLLPEYLDESG